MLKFVLTKNDDNEIQYTYYPEGGSNPGIVGYDKKTGDCTIIAASTDDKHQRYALKMFKRIREYGEKNSFEKEGMIAWY